MGESKQKETRSMQGRGRVVLWSQGMVVGDGAGGRGGVGNGPKRKEDSGSECDTCPKPFRKSGSRIRVLQSDFKKILETCGPLFDIEGSSCTSVLQ